MSNTRLISERDKSRKDDAKTEALAVSSMCYTQFRENSLHSFSGNKVFDLIVSRGRKRSKPAFYQRSRLIQSSLCRAEIVETKTPWTKITQNAEANSRGNIEATLQFKELAVVQLYERLK